MLSFIKRKWYDFLIPISIISGIIYFQIREYFLGIILVLIVPFLLLIPKKVPFWKKTANSHYLSGTLKALIGIIFFLPFMGGVYFYRHLSFYDGLIHIVVSTLICFLVAISLSVGWPLKNWFSRSLLNGNGLNFKKLAIFSLLITALLGLFWEAFEKISDVFLGTQFFKDYFKPITVDTIEDIIADFIGATLGAIYIWKRGKAWKNYFMNKKK